jgi:hypothetical protein
MDSSRDDWYWHEAADLRCPQFGRYRGKPDKVRTVHFHPPRWSVAFFKVGDWSFLEIRFQMKLLQIEQ